MSRSDDMAWPQKIGLIAGAGALPHAVLEGIRSVGSDAYIAAVKGFADASDFDAEGDNFGIAEFGRLFKAFKGANCDGVCFAGIVKRPDFKTLKPDLVGMKMLPGAIKAAAKGDDALLAFIVGACEKQGLTVVAPQDVCQDLLIGEGAQGRHDLPRQAYDDAIKAMDIARAIGQLDIGQGAIVCSGLVLAVEAQEGTDAMLSRLTNLPEALRGTAKKPAGVLAKMIKPGQERRLDLPTIGPATIRLAQAAGLAAIVAKPGEAFILSRMETLALADELGLAIVGIDSDG